MRVSHNLANFHASGALMPGCDIADAWVKQTNATATSDDRTELGSIADSVIKNLKTVRQYIEAELQH